MTEIQANVLEFGSACDMHIIGILGVVQIASNHYLIVVTATTPVIEIKDGEIIHKITNAALVCIGKETVVDHLGKVKEAVV